MDLVSPHKFVVPSSETKIDSPDEGNLLIDDYQFLMMRPEKNSSAGIMIWMTNNLNEETVAVTKRNCRLSPARNEL